MSKDKKKKKKKEKVRYIDDGRSLADMSGVKGGFSSNRPKDGNRFRDQSRTFFEAMKMMVKPMLVTMGIITVAFLITWILFTIAN